KVLGRTVSSNDNDSDSSGSVYIPDDSITGTWQGGQNEPWKFMYILDCDLLIIDDLGTELNNSFTSSQLFYCINERPNSSKSTIISTNHPLNELRD
ncbi:hypothetical protein NE473_32115, partial [Hungatella sp. SL.1.14]|nr:hypothetical protein [Hungatella sp. SL.1.14]